MQAIVYIQQIYQFSRHKNHGPKHKSFQSAQSREKSASPIKGFCRKIKHSFKKATVLGACISKDDLLPFACLR
jgi:hypothetical protein